MDWLTITVGAIFLIGVIVGIYRGAIRIAVSLATTIITLVIVMFATPYLATTIENKTPIDDMIKKQVSSTMANAATSAVSGEDGLGLTADEVRQVLGAAGVSEEQLQSYDVTVDDIVNGNVSADQLAGFGISSSLLDGVMGSEQKEQVEQVIEGAEIPRDVQVAAIEKADLPGVFKTLLTTNNNDEIYAELGVETFAQYVGKFLAKLIINIIAFLCTFIVVTIVLRAIIFALDVVANLPVLGFFNRIAGGMIGVICSLVVVWILFIVLTMLYTTSFGKEAYAVIENNDIMKMIYEYNPIMKLAVNFK